MVSLYEIRVALFTHTIGIGKRMQLTVREVASLFNVSEKSIYRWVKSGDLPVYRLHDQYRFNRSELLEWAILKQLNVSPEILSEPESSDQLLPSLAEAIQSGGIFYRTTGATRDAVIANQVSMIHLPDEVDRRFLTQIILAREALASTGIGDGIAVPHPRTPVGLHVTRPVVAVSFLEHPVEFGSLDGKPVHVLLTIVSPTIRAQLHLLSRIYFVLKNRQLVSLLTGHALREDILKAVGSIEAGFDRINGSDRQVRQH